MGSRKAVFAALLSGLALGVSAGLSPTLAQAVPLPTPAPQPKSYERPQAPRPPQQVAPNAQQQAPAPQQPRQAEQPPAPQQQQQSSGFPSIFPKPPNIFGGSGSTTAFDAKQRQLADRVSTYLSNVRQL